MAVARTENDKALSLARRSVSADPKSSSAQIALSYAQQAAFDLEGARASLEKAVALEPKDALAWARLAEIHSSLGNLDGAFEAARTATELAPNLARTQSVLGYAHLTQVRTGEARAAFARAIELDPSDPLPRLGLGLALIRDGKLAEGSKEIEVAVSLDPGQSLLRSYLGKAYFEAKREDLVGREYELAQQADPKDPTPYLYDAIAKQTTNRPVEALESFQKAVELNDNRAVYRSRLLLDSDAAARSASLGRVFSDLGFQSLALVEGWRSVNTDPSDFSAHRLLADSYAVLPRHEVARVSALLKSQLLQPLNMTPIQPQLGESNLPLVGAGGPGSLSFNEFNPLFNRDRVGAQGSFLVGEDSTLAGEGIVSGIHKKLSFSAGYSGYKTDGFRENADQEDQIANVFAQVELSPSTSIQAEYRYRNAEYGDLPLRFFSDDVFGGQRNTEERHTGRFGLRHTFSPGSVLLASFMYQDATVRPVRRAARRLPGVAQRRPPGVGPQRRGAAHLPDAPRQPHDRRRILRHRRADRHHARDQPGVRAPALQRDRGVLPDGPAAREPLRLLADQARRPARRDRWRQCRPPGGREPGRRGDGPVQPQARARLESAARHHRARVGLPGSQADAHHRPDPRADPGRRVQPVLRRPQRHEVLALRRRHRPEDREAGLRRGGVLAA